MLFLHVLLGARRQNKLAEEMTLNQNPVWPGLLTCAKEHLPAFATEEALWQFAVANGSKPRVTPRLLSGVMSQPRVSEYLSADPAKRVHPQLGAGLLLLRAFEAVRGGRKK